MKIGLMAISRLLWHIHVFSMKFYTGTKNHTPQAILVLKFNCRKIQDGGSRHFEIHINGQNSVIVERIRTKFCTGTKKTSRKQFYLQISLLRKSKMAAVAILKIGLMAIFRSLWHIFERHFTQGLKTIPHKPLCHQNSIPAKSKMAAAAILKFFLTATTPLLLNIFALNLAQRLETTSRKQFYLQISLQRKPKMAAAAILKIGLKAISRTIWLIFALNFANGLKTVSHSRFCCKNSLSAKSLTLRNFTRRRGAGHAC